MFYGDGMKLTKPQQKELLRIANEHRFSYEAAFFNSLPQRNLVKYGLAETFTKREPLGGQSTIGKAMVEWNFIRLTFAGKHEALRLLYPELSISGVIAEKCSCGWIYPEWPVTEQHDSVRRNRQHFRGLPCKSEYLRCSSKVTFGTYNRKTKRYECV